MTTAPPTSARQFPCTKCGAALVYAPGTTTLTCQYCGAPNAIPQTAEVKEVVEHDFEAELARLHDDADNTEVLTVKCDTCAAESVLQPNQTAGLCPFCGQPIVAQAQTKKSIKPQYLLPFAVTSQQSAELFRRWIASLWFAPSDLKAFAERGGLRGIYTPAWTYDCSATTQYEGQRGDDYWVTEYYTETDANGRTVQRERQVVRTRWSYASGVVNDSFDDLLVMASRSLPEDCIEHLRPWDLQSLVAYQDEYLAGFTAESYQIGLPDGFEVAKQMTVPQIEGSIRQDIGGDHQQISGMSPQYFDITYKHVLLPVWLSSYRYRGRLYRFLINARTGDVRGERPWSPWKITFLIVGITLAIAVGALIAAHR
jgi:ribosomal protein S27E